MRSKVVLSILVASLMLLAGCGTTIGPGYAGIEVNQFGSQRGVSDFPVKTGYVAYNPLTTSVIEYPVFVQTASWTKNPNEGNPTDESITFTTKDNMVVNADVSLSYQQNIDKIPAFYVKFHLDKMDGYTHGFLHNIVRDKMNEIGGKYTVEQIMGDNAPYLTEVRAAVQNEVNEYGTQVVQFGFIGAPRPPEGVINAINAKVQATQIALQKQNEVLQAEADAKKRVAVAQGEAEANRTLANSITPSLVQWRQMDLQQQQIGKWNGVLPTVTGSGASGLLLNVKP